VSGLTAKLGGGQMFKIVVSDPKTKKAYQVKKELPILAGKKIGEKFDGSVLGLNGFTLEITGGSDNDGFPMRKDLDGTMRRKALLTKGTGFRGYKIKKKRGKKIKVRIKGMRRRKYIRGNTISNNIAQVNCKILEGKGDIAKLLGIEKKEETGEKKVEQKPVEKPKEVKEEKPKEEVKKEKSKPKEVKEKVKEPEPEEKKEGD
jgi:small subunit ribosomal protein S6e